MAASSTIILPSHGPSRDSSDLVDATLKQLTRLSPEELESALEREIPLPANAEVVIGDRGFGVFGYLINLLRVDTCLKAARSRPLPTWLEHKMDSAGKFPLHWSVTLARFDEDSFVDLVEALLIARADPNCRDKDTFGLRVAGARNRDLSSKCGGKTPLHYLCCSVKESPTTLQGIELLLRCGALSTLEDYDGNTASALAQMARNDMSALLLGATVLEPAVAAEQFAAYDRRCTERELSWAQLQNDQRLKARHAFAERLAAEYNPRHPELYNLNEHHEFFEPSFLVAIDEGTVTAIRTIRDFKELSLGLFQYRIFREEVCQQLMEEVEHFNAFATASGLEIARPNSMNRYGLILNDIGFLGTIHKLMQNFIQPLATALFSHRFGHGFCFQSVHTFIVRYKTGEDLDLKTHSDDSDLTLNICLGKHFEGASLYFHSDKGACGCVEGCCTDVSEEFAYPHPSDCRFCTFHYHHTPGIGLMHVGQHVHGVDQLRSGERSNLIFWCRTRRYPDELRAELPL